MQTALILIPQDSCDTFCTNSDPKIKTKINLKMFSILKKYLYYVS
jgi:hypothetical protein